MANTTNVRLGVHAIAMRIAVIAVAVLGIGELIALVNRELWPYLPSSVEPFGALPFYSIWIVVALAYRVAWPALARTEWRVRIVQLAARDRLAIAIAGVLAASMYYQAIVTVVSTGPRTIGVDLISAAVVGPLVEEWIFRGLVWNQIVAAMAGRRGADTVALLASSIVFGLFHTAFEGHTWQGLYQAVGHAEFGVLVGVMRWRSRSLTPGSIIHGVGNLFARLAMP